MRKLVVSEFLSLDGVMQSPGYPDEDRSGGFEQGGWQQPYFDDVFGKKIAEGLAATGAVLLGRRTYEIFAGHWPKQPAEDPLAGIFNKLPKYVVSTTLKKPLEWENSNLISVNVVEEISKLKEPAGKDIQVFGSAELVRTLMHDDLVDEYRLMIHPLTLGNGKRLFRDGGMPTRLRLADSKTTSTGVLLLSYVKAR